MTRYRPVAAVGLVLGLHRLVNRGIYEYERDQVESLFRRRRSAEATGRFFLQSLVFSGFLFSLLFVPLGIAVLAAGGRTQATSLVGCLIMALGVGWSLGALLVKGTLAPSERTYITDWRVLSADGIGFLIALVLGSLLYVITAP